MKNKIIKIINGMAGKQSVYQIFDDWIAMLALEMSIAIDVFTGEERVKQHKAYLSKYTKEELDKFAELTACLVDALEEEPSDILGYIYMHLESGSSALGQFFTPYHICELMARVGFDENNIPKVINEPSCGAGGNIIAVLMLYKEKGINYQKDITVVCQDLDYRCVYMCYVQLSLLGAKAKVVQGNTLVNPYDATKTNKNNVFITPMYLIGQNKIGKRRRG